MPKCTWVASTKGSDDIFFDRLIDACKHVRKIVQGGKASDGSVSKRLINPDDTLGKTVARIEISRVEANPTMNRYLFYLNVVRESGRASAYVRVLSQVGGCFVHDRTRLTERTLCAYLDGKLVVMPLTAIRRGSINRIGPKNFNKMLANGVLLNNTKKDTVTLSDNIPLANYLLDAGMVVFPFTRFREHSSIFYETRGETHPNEMAMPASVVHVVDLAVGKGTIEHLVLGMVSNLVYFRLGSGEKSRITKNIISKQMVQFAKTITLGECPNQEPVYGFGPKCKLYSRVDQNNTNDWYTHDWSITERFINFVIDNEIALYVNDKLDFYTVRPEDEVLLKIAVF